MADFIRSWILGLTGAALICAVITELCPVGSTKKVLKLLCGLVMTISLISPLIRGELPDLSVNMAKYRTQADAISASAKESADSYSRAIIEEECRAYILDKAHALGADVKDASVILRWNEGGFWYPTECAIDAEYNAALAQSIEFELGLGRESQKWGTNESD